MKKNGFTLIELVVTIALIGVIAAISFVSINGLVREDRINKCNSLINNIKSASMEYVSDNRYNNTFVNQVNNNKIIIDTNNLKSYLEGEINLYKNNIKYDQLKVIVTLDDNYKYNNSLVSINDNIADKIDCSEGEWEIR